MKKEVPETLIGSTLSAKWHSFHFEVLSNERGIWVQIAETRPNGRRQSIVVESEYVEGFQRELLKAVSAVSAAPNVAHSASAVRPREYDEWSSFEESVLAFLHRTGASVAEIAAALQRQTGGVRSRLRRLSQEQGGSE